MGFAGSSSKVWIFSFAAVVALAVTINLLLPEEPLKSNEEEMLDRCEKAISALQADLDQACLDQASGQSVAGRIKLMVLNCDFIFEKLDAINCSNLLDLRSRRKLHVERLHGISQLVDKLALEMPTGVSTEG